MMGLASKFIITLVSSLSLFCLSEILSWFESSLNFFPKAKTQSKFPLENHPASSAWQSTAVEGKGVLPLKSHY